MEAHSGPDGGRYSAQLRETATLVANEARARGWTGIWSGSPVPGRRRCPGSSPTSTTTWRRWPRPACGGGGEPDRLHLRPSRGGLGPGHRGGRDGRGTGAAFVRAATPGNDPPFRGDGPGSRRGAARPGGAAGPPRRAAGVGHLPAGCCLPARRSWRVASWRSTHATSALRRRRGRPIRASRGELQAATSARRQAMVSGRSAASRCWASKPLMAPPGATSAARASTRSSTLARAKRRRARGREAGRQVGAVVGLAQGGQRAGQLRAPGGDIEPGQRGRGLGQRGGEVGLGLGRARLSRAERRLGHAYACQTTISNVSPEPDVWVRTCGTSPSRPAITPSPASSAAAVNGPGPGRPRGSPGAGSTSRISSGCSLRQRPDRLPQRDVGPRARARRRPGAPRRRRSRRRRRRRRRCRRAMPAPR